MTITHRKTKVERSGKIHMILVFISLLLELAILFGAAGTLLWPAAGVFAGMRFLSFFAGSIWAARKNPAVVNERGRKSDKTKSWDKKFEFVFVFVIFLTPLLAGLDMRFGWSNMPIFLQIVGFIGLIPGLFLPYWAMAENPYLVTTARIQDERGQQVITTGPYRIVRHPMYLGAVLFYICTPLLLGSWYALLVGCVGVMSFIVRTKLEDQMLQDELPGYVDFTQQTRCRLLPGVW